MKMPIEEINSLSLLAHKVAANVFDLSSRQFNVSIRDQMVRAQQVVTDLKEAHRSARSLLVVGMGSAGVTAALSAWEAGFEEVRVVDVEARPFSLFHGVGARFVGPYMYEWPSAFHHDQSYPAHGATPWRGHGTSPLTWSAAQPVSADTLAAELTGSLNAWFTRAAASDPACPLPELFVNVDRKAISDFVRDFAAREAVRAMEDAEGAYRSPRVCLTFMGPDATRWNAPPGATPAAAAFTPQYVILAMGMGKEKLCVPGTRTPASPSFWANDDLKSDAMAYRRVVVLGGGDGAIQDTLRILTPHDHPLSLIRALERTPAVRDAIRREIPALLDADRQLRQHAGWSRDDAGLVMADTACRHAAARLARNPIVVREVRKNLRDGTGEVLHLVRGGHFDKAYMLNRFAIYLLAACMRRVPAGAGRHMRLALRFGAGVRRCVDRRRRPWGFRSAWTLRLGGSRVFDADTVVVRFGVEPDSVPGPTLIQLSRRDSSQRSTLARVELPFVALRKKVRRRAA